MNEQLNVFNTLFVFVCECRKRSADFSVTINNASEMNMKNCGKQQIRLIWCELIYELIVHVHPTGRFTLLRKSCALIFQKNKKTTMWKLPNDSNLQSFDSPNKNGQRNLSMLLFPKLSMCVSFFTPTNVAFQQLQNIYVIDF